MRKSVVVRLVFGVFAVSALGVWVACGGSDPQDVTNATDSGADTSSGRFDADTTPVDSSTVPKDSGVPETSKPVERDAGKQITLYPDGGEFAEAGIPCFEGGELEVESNDTLAQANPLRPIRCGFARVEDGGADGGESDWLKFEIGDASTGFFVKYFGDVQVKVETDGRAPVDITKPDASLIFLQGQPYYVEVKSSTGKTEKWRIVLFEDK